MKWQIGRGKITLKTTTKSPTHGKTAPAARHHSACRHPFFVLWGTAVGPRLTANRNMGQVPGGGSTLTHYLQDCLMCPAPRAKRRWEESSQCPRINDLNSMRSRRQLHSSETDIKFGDSTALLIIVTNTWYVVPSPARADEARIGTVRILIRDHHLWDWAA